MIVNDAQMVLGEGKLCNEVQQSAAHLIVEFERLKLRLAAPKDGMAQPLTLFDAAYRHFTRYGHVTGDGNIGWRGGW
jgi:signal-transduction protein with cAMP-binding, CBS, and nucleotidyltransferase domain